MDACSDVCVWFACVLGACVYGGVQLTSELFISSPYPLRRLSELDSELVSRVSLSSELA